MAYNKIKPIINNIIFNRCSDRTLFRSSSVLKGKPYADNDETVLDGKILAKQCSFKNIFHCENIGDKPFVKKNAVCAYPSLLFPDGFEYENFHGGGFLSYTGTEFMTESLFPYTFIDSDLKAPFMLGQYGPTLAEDCVLTYTDDDKTYALMAYRPAKKMVTICGGGMMNINAESGETGKRELREEGVKHVHPDYEKEFNDALDNSRIVYAGMVWDDPRNSGNAWMETIARTVRISKECAMSMKLETSLDDDGECDVEKPHWMEITEENMEKNNVIECHRMILRRAIHCYDIRYCNSFEVPWTEEQLMKLKATAINQEKDHGRCKYDGGWAKQNSLDPTIILPILGPSKFDRKMFHKIFSEVCKKSLSDEIMRDIIFWDPMNSKLDAENQDLCRKFEHSVIANKASYPTFILPKDLMPKVTFDEMQFVIINDLVDRTSIYIQYNDGKEDELIAHIPYSLHDKIVFFDTFEEVAQDIIDGFD